MCCAVCGKNEKVQVSGNDLEFWEEKIQKKITDKYF